LFRWFLRRAQVQDALNLVFLRVLIPKKDSQDDDRKETIKDMKEYIGIMEQLLTAVRSIYQESVQASIF
jgi:hypothetical protein